MLAFPPLLYEPGSWIGSATPVVIPLLIGLAVLAFRGAAGGHSGLQRYLAGDVPTLAARLSGIQGVGCARKGTFPST